MSNSDKTEFVLPISAVIIVGLFVIQYRGTHSVGRLFGPVMVVWFAAGQSLVAWVRPVLRFSVPVACMIAALALFVAVTLPAFKAANFHPFMPHGFFQQGRPQFRSQVRRRSNLH